MNAIFDTDEDLMEKDVFSLLKEYLKKELYGDPIYDESFHKIWNAINEIEYHLIRNFKETTLGDDYRFVGGINAFHPDDFVDFLYLNYLGKLEKLGFNNVRVSFEQYTNENAKEINEALSEFYNDVFRHLIYLIIKSYVDYLEKYGLHDKYYFIEGLLKYLNYIVNTFEIVNALDNYELSKIKQLYILLLKPIYRDYHKAYISPIDPFNNFIKNIYNLTIEFSYVEWKEELWLPIESEDSQKYIVVNEKDERFFEVYDVYLSSENLGENVSTLFLSQSLIISALESIEGVSVKVDDVSIGSLYTRFKMILKSAFARKEVKQTIMVAAEIAGNQIGTSVSGTLKNLEEVKKTQIENEVASRENEAGLTVEQLRQRNEISLEKEKLEKRKLEAEVIIFEQEAIQKKIQTAKQLAELMSQGFLSADEVRMHINGQLLINKEPSKIEITGIDEVFPD